MVRRDCTASLRGPHLKHIHTRTRWSCRSCSSPCPSCFPRHPCCSGTAASEVCWAPRPPPLRWACGRAGAGPGCVRAPPPPPPPAAAPPPRRGSAARTSAAAPRPRAASSCPRWAHPRSSSTLEKWTWCKSK